MENLGRYRLLLVFDLVERSWMAESGLKNRKNKGVESYYSIDASISQVQMYTSPQF